MKRVRTPKAAPNELVIRWGRADGDGPDVCYAWGAECSKSDAHLLHNHLGSERPDFSVRPIFSAMLPSIWDELKARGYDLTTLRFSIRKENTPNLS